MAYSTRDSAGVVKSFRTYTSGSDNVTAHALDPVASGGLSTYRNLDLGSTGQVVKSSAGQIYGWHISNNGASAIYIKFYNKATAATSSDTPVETRMIPAGAAANVLGAIGIAFSTGISIRATTGVADNNTTSPGSNEAVVNLYYC